MIAIPKQFSCLSLEINKGKLSINGSDEYNTKVKPVNKRQERNSEYIKDYCDRNADRAAYKSDVFGNKFVFLS